jgi:dTDP-4-dehydrorhamnose reductase
VLVIARNVLDRAQDKQLRGVFHLACTGETNWAEFASAIFDSLRPLDNSVPVAKPITTAEYPTPARRPANSRLDCSKLARLHGIQLPSLRASLKHCLSRLMNTIETEEISQNEKGCK